MIHLDQPLDDTIVELRNTQASSPVVFVCEHASAHIPPEFANLGLRDEALKSHVVWDPGAFAVAERMATAFDAVLIAAKTSRLVYDCNRPPHAPDAMPAHSEIVDVPGNTGLSAEQKAGRVERFYEPFRSAVSGVLASIDTPVLVTVHSFTPVYHGRRRDVEIGVLHDKDARLADAFLAAAADSHSVVRRNEPYGPGDGVTHTLKEHALPAGHLNVMLEVRSDLIATNASQVATADTLSGWLQTALATTRATAC
ncbi:MAG: N-formylglutamate amidohydrolase [Silicimonas sp.]|nr:N-formylglutamate amidohydrolase [Silicimonas sp.]